MVGLVLGTHDGMGEKRFVILNVCEGSPETVMGGCFVALNMTAVLFYNFRGTFLHVSDFYAMS
jgi:hypothetical protein